MLDRLALGVTSIFALLCAAIVFGHRGYFWGASACVLTAWLFVHRYLAKHRQMDPAELLVERASKLAKLFPAAFVVMGHTHVPVRVAVNEGASTYINVGSWAEEESDPLATSSYRAARTHLVIHPKRVGRRRRISRVGLRSRASRVRRPRRPRDPRVVDPVEDPGKMDKSAA